VPPNNVLMQNAVYLAMFLAYTSLSEGILSFNNFLILHDEFLLPKQSWEKLSGYVRRVSIQWLAIGMSICYVAMAVFVPILALFNFSVVLLATDWYFVRYAFMFVYVIARHIPYGAIDDIKTLIADGCILPQIVSMYLFNEISIEMVVISLPVTMMWLNRRMALQIMLYEKEPRLKTTFVRLIG
jgi:uncharacterized membrane protein